MKKTVMYHHTFSQPQTSLASISSLTLGTGSPSSAPMKLSTTNISFKSELL